jgi:hypothetical protein
MPLVHQGRGRPRGEVGRGEHGNKFKIKNFLIMGSREPYAVIAGPLANSYCVIMIMIIMIMNPISGNKIHRY